MVEKLPLFRALGLRGGFKSVYHTLRRDATLLVTSRTILDLHSEASIEGGRILFGYGNSRECHPRLRKGYLSVGQDASLIVSGDNGWLVGPGCTVRVEGDLTVGNSYVNSDTRIICEDEITIGDGTSISWGVEILDSNRHDIWKRGKRINRTDSISIGDNVLIGHNSIIGKGVSIGNNSIIAAGSQVINDIQDGVIAAGTPAEPVDEIDRWN